MKIPQPPFDPQNSDVGGKKPSHVVPAVNSPDRRTKHMMLRNVRMVPSMRIPNVNDPIIVDPNVTLSPMPTVGGDPEQTNTRVLVPTKMPPGKNVTTVSV